MRVSNNVSVTYCLTGLDSTKLVNLLTISATKLLKFSNMKREYSLALLRINQPHLKITVIIIFLPFYSMEDSASICTGG